MRVADIDVTAPDPASAIAHARTDETCRLRVMNHEQVLTELHAGSVLFVVEHEYVFGLRGEVVFAAMQRVVKAFRDFEEVVAAGNDLPLGVNFQFIHQWNKAIEDFGDAAAYGGRAHHLDRFPLQLPREKVEFIEFGAADDGLVVIQTRRW